MSETVKTRFGLARPFDPSPIPIDALQPPERKPPEWMKPFCDDTCVFAALTAWREVKWLDVLLDTFARASGCMPNAPLIVAGLVHLGYCADSIAAAQDDHRILFLGSLS